MAMFGRWRRKEQELSPALEPGVIEARNISKIFEVGGQSIEALREVSLRCGPHEITVLKGPSGVGKTTLLKILTLNLPPSAGTLTIEGAPAPLVPSAQAARLRGEKIGMVFQDLLLDERLSTLENIVLPLAVTTKTAPSLADQQWATELSEILGISHRLHFNVSVLSGGERQRVAIARAMMKRPPFLVLDEPTASLDEERALEIMNALHSLAELGHCIILATHTAHADTIATRIVRFDAAGA